MQYASEERVREILTTQFDVDIRTIEIEGSRFSATFEDNVVTILCEWGELPEGHSINGSNMYWVRRWTKWDNQEISEEYQKVVDRIIDNG